MILPSGISPTHKGVRPDDDYGSGRFGADRVSRVHLGVDYWGVPGQAIVLPMDGKIIRHRHPYADDLTWDGLLIDCGHDLMMTCYYIQWGDGVEESQSYTRGAHIGWLQDLQKRYPADETHQRSITPHVHVEFRWPDGEPFPSHWHEGREWLRKQRGSMPGIYINPELILSI